jgi:hypothetical protein
MIEKNTLEKMYLNDHKTIYEIAEYFGVSDCTVCYWKKKYNIRKVERWERYELKFFSEKQKEYLYGSLLGDDRLNMDGKRKYPYLAATHSIKQNEYIQWKYKIWEQIAPNGIKSVVMNVKGKQYFAKCFSTGAHPDFLNFFNLFYSSGRKKINQRILDNLTPFSLAVWYMDDGYYGRSRGRSRISTNSFTYDENLLIKNYFRKKWNISVNIGTSDSGSNYIWFNTENTIKFFKIIKDYIIPFFDYKIDIDRKLQWKALSKEEIDYIQKNYNIESPRLIAKRLNRPLCTIFSTAFRLGVTQCRGGRKYYKKDL